MCDIADDQVGRLVEAIQLESDWLEDILARISLKDEVERVREERRAVHDGLRRLGRRYQDRLCDDAEYDRL